MHDRFQKVRTSAEFQGSPPVYYIGTRLSKHSKMFCHYYSLTSNAENDKLKTKQPPSSVVINAFAFTRRFVELWSNNYAIHFRVELGVIALSPPTRCVQCLMWSPAHHLGLTLVDLDMQTSKSSLLWRPLLDEHRLNGTGSQCQCARVFVNIWFISRHGSHSEGRFNITILFARWLNGRESDSDVTLANTLKNQHNTVDRMGRGTGVENTQMLPWSNYHSTTMSEVFGLLVTVGLTNQHRIGVSTTRQNWLYYYRMRFLVSWDNFQIT